MTPTMQRRPDCLCEPLAFGCDGTHGSVIAIGADVSAELGQRSLAENDAALGLVERGSIARRMDGARPRLVSRNEHAVSRIKPGSLLAHSGASEMNR